MDHPLDEAHQSKYTASIIVPVHNEVERGFRALGALREVASERHVLVVVVCNGCTDNSADLVRSIPEVLVLERSEASKTAALNAGDLAASDVFPRLYVDADVEISAESLLRLIAALAGTDVRAVGPSVSFDTTNAPWVVRKYCQALESLPFLVSVRRSHLDGRGVYGVNRAGRARFTAFPPIRGDDTFFDRMFSESEKVTVQDAHVGLAMPTSIAAFFRARARSAQGAHQTTAWIAAHRPDRLVVSVAQADPLGGVWSRVRHHRRQSGLVSAWSRTSLTELAAFVLVEAVARTRARLLDRAGRAARWR